MALNLSDFKSKLSKKMANVRIPGVVHKEKEAEPGSTTTQIAEMIADEVDKYLKSLDITVTTKITGKCDVDGIQYDISATATNTVTKK